MQFPLSQVNRSPKQVPDCLQFAGSSSALGNGYGVSRVLLGAETETETYRRPCSPPLRRTPRCPECNGASPDTGSCRADRFGSCRPVSIDRPLIALLLTKFKPIKDPECSPACPRRCCLRNRYRFGTKKIDVRCRKNGLNSRKTQRFTKKRTHHKASTALRRCSCFDTSGAQKDSWSSCSWRYKSNCARRRSLCRGNRWRHRRLFTGEKLVRRPAWTRHPRTLFTLCLRYALVV